MNKLKIAAYIKISVATEKDQDSTSIENQRKIIQEYIKSNFPESELTFFVDKGQYEDTFEQRENYPLMKKHLIDGDFDILIFKDFSRFSRRTTKCLIELENYKDLNIRVISINDNIDYPSVNSWNDIQSRFLLG